MSNEQSSSPRRALVLGGGGVAGIAWHIGMMSELVARGADLGAADLVIGTSAGSVAGAVLRFGQVESAYDIQTSSDTPDLPAAGPIAPPLDMSTFRERVMTMIAGARDAQEARARLGTAALAMTAGAGESILVPTLEAQFPSALGWPAEPFGVCVVDATTGEFRVLDASSGVELPRAVAASCSVPLVFPPVDIEGRPHVDGGMRSATNADLADGYGKVLILACGPEDPANPLGPQLDEAVTGLRASGSDVLVLSADEVSLRAFGGNSLAASSRIPSAHAGRAQAAGIADEVLAFWS